MSVVEHRHAALCSGSQRRPFLVRTTPTAIIPASTLANNQPKALLISPKEVAQYRLGARGEPGLLDRHEARIRTIKARIGSKWRGLASR